MRTSDGTPISASTYLALAGLAGEGLVCPDCLAAPDVLSDTQASHSADGSGLSAPGYTETPLDEAECRRLLATQTIGRLAFTERALPVVVPAHFVVRGPEIVLAGLNDGRVVTARKRAIVAFGVDAYDARTQQGWWVSSLGRSRLITDRRQIRELDDLAFTPWAHNRECKYIAVDIDVLRGKRLAPTATPDQ